MMSQQSKVQIASVASRARSASLDLNSMAMELDNIITTLPTTKDQALFKETTLSKPLRFVKSQSHPLPELSKMEKQIELNGITQESLNLNTSLFKDSKRTRATVVISKFLQCLLWDFGFRFTLLPHQFEAVYATAGIKVSSLLDEVVHWDDRKLGLIVKLDTRSDAGKQARETVCKKYISFTRNKGTLLCDAMGLGKTVESLAATVLRNGIYSIKIEAKLASSDVDTSKYVILPTLIIAPNEAVLHQWEESLIMSGVDTDHIKYFDSNDKKLLRHEKDYILMTRYELMTEVRKLLKGHPCVIFPHIPQETLKSLADVIGKNEKGYSEAVKVAQITNILGTNMKLVKGNCFRSLIIDEAHMMKNLATYWGVGAGLLTALSQRTIPLSGTPFIHDAQDMATLMVYINGALPQAQKFWWTKATSPYSPGADAIKEVKEWRSSYFIRRKKSILTKELPTKTITEKNVGCFASEMTVYNEHEAAYFDGLNAFLKMAEAFGDKRELVNFLFAQLTCMRMSTIHPLLTKGREFTIKFSPSRRDNVQLTRDVSKVCVCCKMGVIRNKDEGCDDPENKLVPVPAKLCYAANSSCPHYIHVKCLKLLESKGGICPRCEEFQNLTQVDAKLAYKIPYPTYSQNVFVSNDVSGFKATSKIQQVVEWVQSIPEGDKAIVYSFFEGSLDLLEGIFVENLNIECARFDDDVDPDTQAIELNRFKKSPTCNLLLATVQSSGTGLNIEEANHIAFLDRCFDTSVHRQAEDRCHNLRQKKEVEVTYFDASMTVDEIMKALNLQTSTNDTVRLIDGTEVGKKEPTIKYNNLSGEIRRMLKAVEQERKLYLQTNPENALTPCKTDLTEVMKDKENAPSFVTGSQAATVPQGAKQPAFMDASNREKRVSFGSIGSNRQVPVITPRRVQPTQVFQSPNAYNYLTAMQSPFTPSLNFAAYPFGSFNQQHNTGQANIFQNTSSGFYRYPNDARTNASVPVYHRTTNSQTPTAPVSSNQKSKIIFAKRQSRTKNK